MSELGDFKQLATEVEQGNLRLKIHRDKLDGAIKGLQDLIDHIEGLRYDIETVAQVSGFGGFQMGLDLAQKFTRKGSGDGGIRQRAKEAVEELQAAQDVIRKASQAYVETDEAYKKEFEGYKF
ncbi:hypothetical protein ACFYU5_22140 [Nocardia aobensis]|uniref:ESX-1 secretion-associated protein n=1 Tax=Nocardia aobensis TaxID=257277 RepID=A0ABW6P7I1_9NOCA